jgi:hypothetical protein
MKMNYLLVLFLIAIGLSAAAETQDNLLDPDDVDLKMIPPILIDWINQGYNWVVAHIPQITNSLQNAINNFNVRQALSDWVKSKLGTETLAKKGLCQLVIMALKKVLRI